MYVYVKIHIAENLLPNYSATLPTEEESPKERQIRLKQQIEEALQRDDWTIRRQPTRPKSEFSRKQREQQYLEQMSTHIYPILGLKMTERDKKIRQISIAIWILIDLFFLLRIWELEGKVFDFDAEKLINIKFRKISGRRKNMKN